MTQPTPAEQLLNLADRAERGTLTGAEAARLREGVAHHCARAEKAEAAIERVRKALEDMCEFEPHPRHDHWCPNDVRDVIRAALEPQEQQT